MLRITTERTGNIQGLPYYSTHYFAGSTAGEADAAAAALNTFWADMDAHISTLLTWTTAQEAEFVDPVTGNITGIEPVTSATGAGAQGGDMLPMFTQGLVRWRTGEFISGREIRGRTFIPGPTEAQSTGGDPTPGYVDAVRTVAAAFITAASGGGGLVIYSPTHGQFGNVQTTTVWNRWATLRSRRD